MDFFTKIISLEQYEGVHTSIYVSNFDNNEHVNMVVDDIKGSKQKTIDPSLPGVNIKMLKAFDFPDPIPIYRTEQLVLKVPKPFC